VTVRRLDGQPLNITNTVHSGMAKVQIEPVTGGNGAEVRIDISIPAAEKPSYFWESIGLFTDDSHVAQPVGVLNVNGRWVDALMATPEQLNWNLPPDPKWDSAAPWQVRTLKLRSIHSDQPFNILDIKTNLDGFQTSTKPRENNIEAEIAIRLVKAPGKTEQGTVIITTDHPTVPKIEVPFLVYVPNR
jgi:hypothetical protein